jgi:hypothetical protein
VFNLIASLSKALLSPRRGRNSFKLSLSSICALDSRVLLAAVTPDTAVAYTHTGNLINVGSNDDGIVNWGMMTPPDIGELIFNEDGTAIFTYNPWHAINGGSTSFTYRGYWTEFEGSIEDNTYHEVEHFADTTVSITLKPPYKLIVNSDQPMEGGDRDYIQNDDVGHAFLTLVTPESASYSYGFYPAGVQDDDGHDSDASKMFVISPDAFSTVMTSILADISNQRGGWNIATCNCVDWVLEKA